MRPTAARTTQAPKGRPPNQGAPFQSIHPTNRRHPDGPLFNPTTTTRPPPVIPAPRHSGESRKPRPLTPPTNSTLRTPNSKFPRHPPVIPAKAGNHAPPTLRDSVSTPRRRSTTETAEARKGRGPRFSSGRRGRAIPPPVIPAKAWRGNLELGVRSVELVGGVRGRGFRLSPE